MDNAILKHRRGRTTDRSIDDDDDDDDARDGKSIHSIHSRIRDVCVVPTRRISDDDDHDDATNYAHHRGWGTRDDASAFARPPRVVRDD